MIPLNSIIYILLALSLCTQGLFALDLNQEIDAFILMLEPNNSIEEELPLNYSQVNYLSEMGVHPYYKAQTLTSKTKLNNYEFFFQVNQQDVSYTSEGTSYTQSAPLNSFYLKAPILLNKTIQIKSLTGWNSYPIIGVNIHWEDVGLDFSLLQRQERYAGKLGIEDDQIELSWRSLVQEYEIHWQYFVKNFQYNLSYEGSRSQPFNTGEVYLSRQEILTHHFTQRLAWQSFTSSTHWVQKSASVELNGINNPDPFAQAPWSMNFFHQDFVYGNWGVHLSSLNLVAPKPMELQTLNPQNFPFEGLQSFWFVQNNDFLRWGGSLDILTASLSYSFNRKIWEGSGWSLDGGLSQKLGRSYYQIQEVREINTRWLGFVPVSSEVKDYNSQVNSLDFYAVGLELQGSFGLWGVGLKLSQIIPLYHSQNTAIKDQWKSTDGEDVGPRPEDTLQSQDLVVDDYSYQWGDGMGFEMTIRRSF